MMNNSITGGKLYKDIKVVTTNNLKEHSHHIKLPSYIPVNTRLYYLESGVILGYNKYRFPISEDLLIGSIISLDKLDGGKNYFKLTNIQDKYFDTDDGVFNIFLNMENVDSVEYTKYEKLLKDLEHED